MSKTIIFNWKMNLPILSELSEAIKSNTPVFLEKERGNMVIVCPPFTHIEKVGELLKGTGALLGAQNISTQDSGALTGEISAPMLKDLGILFSIVGHSERRYVFGETDEMISQKIKEAVLNGITPILCVGEKEVMENEKAWEFVKNQLDSDLFLVKNQIKNIIVAYEPVWAIGGDKQTDAPHSAFVIGKVKEYLSEVQFSVLYGGSVNCKNISTFLEYNQIDGFLVGSASLKTEEVDCLLSLI